MTSPSSPAIVSGASRGALLRHPFDQRTAGRADGQHLGPPIDGVLAPNHQSAIDLAEFVGITEANLSLLRQGKVKGMRFDTLEAICTYLRCEPGDLLNFVPGEAEEPKP